MSKELIATIRKRRELTVKVDHMTFTARRPTDVEFVEIHRKGDETLNLTFARNFVVGWEDVTENDVAGGGGSDIVPFDPELWAEFIEDRPDLWKAIGGPVWDAYVLHREQAKALEKN